MGLFGYIKALSHGGNFGLIPRNWTYIYLRLFQQHKDCFADPSAIMTAASVINANAYLDTRGLRMDDLDHILDYALAGTCGPVRSMPTQDGTRWSIRHGAPGSFMDSGEASYDLILNYCVQYTAVLLAIDTPQFSARSVVESCIKAKPKIENSIASLNRDLSRGAGNSYIWNAAAATAVELGPNSCTTKYMLKLINDAPDVQEFSKGTFGDTSGNRKRAEQGDAAEQYKLGCAFEDGCGVREDHKEAVKWLRLAAEQGHVQAQFYLGKKYSDNIVVYSNGEPFQNDYKEAVKWFRLAAEQGHADAQYDLGCAYGDGHGVPQDYKEAVKWFRLAAEQGHADAQYDLGCAYGNGHGVPQETKEAVKWFRLAAEQGSEYARSLLEEYNAQDKEIPQDYEEAVKWFRLAAEQGDALAQVKLGHCYERGEGIPIDYKEAIKWYRLAAAQGSAKAQYNLGGCYYQGIIVPQDYKEAVKLFRLAAEQGYAIAQFLLGLVHNSGHGVPQDYIQAYAWLKIAATQGLEVAKEYCEETKKKMTPAQVEEGQRLAREYAEKYVKVKSKSSEMDWNQCNA